MELKNKAWELCETYTNTSSLMNQVEERISESKDQFNEMKCEDKIREKRMKRNEQSLQEVWGYLKRPNPCLFDVPESDRKNGTKLKNTLQDIIQENFPNLARQASTQIQETQRIQQRYSSRKATPRHIIIRFIISSNQGWNEGKNVKGSQRERSRYSQREAHQTNSGSLCRNPISQKRVGANIQHP